MMAPLSRISCPDNIFLNQDELSDTIDLLYQDSCPCCHQVGQTVMTAPFGTYYCHFCHLA